MRSFDFQCETLIFMIKKPMDTYTLAPLILSSALLIGYLGHRFLKLQTSIAIMSAALLMSLAFNVLKYFGYSALSQDTAHLLTEMNFSGLVLNGMLSFLLFAGAMSIDTSALKDNRWEIFTLSSLSTVLSFFMIGFGSYYLLPYLGIHLSLIYCLLFGALISPTDPIAVIATLKKIKAPKQLEVCIAGESLFNDGVGIVLFVTCYSFALNNTQPTLPEISHLFFQQVLGGLSLGFVLGLLMRGLIRYSDEPRLAIFGTIACVSGGYSLASFMNISGPLAMVVAGLMVSSFIHHPDIVPRIRAAMEFVWELIEELLNAVLFLLLGFEVLILDTHQLYIPAIIFTIILVLIVRWISVAAPLMFFHLKRRFPRYMISSLVWGGIRGGLAVALALSTPDNPSREIILGLTYGVVAFGIIVQGLSINPLVRLMEKNLK